MKPTIDINLINIDALNDARRAAVARVVAAYQEPLRKALEDALLAAVTTDATIEEATRHALAAAEATIDSISASRPSSAPREAVLPLAPYVAALPISTPPGETPKAAPPPLAPGFRTPLPFPPMASNGGAGNGSPASIPSLPPAPPPVAPGGQALAPGDSMSLPPGSPLAAPALLGADHGPTATDQAKREAAIAGWRHLGMDEKWSQHARFQFKDRERELYRYGALEAKFPVGFVMPPGLFHDVVRALRPTEQEALSIYDLDRATGSWGLYYVLYALNELKNYRVLRAKLAETKGPAARYWLPEPAGDDKDREAKHKLIDQWRRTFDGSA